VAQQPNRAHGASFFMFLGDARTHTHAHTRTHTHAHTHTHTQPVGLLRTSFQPDEVTTYVQHTTGTRDFIHAPRGIRTLDPRSRTAADLCLRSHGHRDRLNVTLVKIIAKMACYSIDSNCTRVQNLYFKVLPLL
jgi:hypothetical protein